MNPEQELIVYSRLLKLLNGRRLLDIERLVINRSQTLLLTGANGSGKTTLLKILAGLEAPDYCNVYYGQCRFSWKQARLSSRLPVIYLHQHPYLFDTSVANNIAYGLRRAGYNRQKTRHLTAEALAWSQLEHLADRNAKQLSGGERQRVALARARILHPRLLLLDEPISSMDQSSCEQTFFLVRHLRQEGVAVVITSHQTQQLGKLADRRLVLEKGKLSEMNAGETFGAAGSARGTVRVLSASDQWNPDRHG